MPFFALANRPSTDSRSRAIDEIPRGAGKGRVRPRRGKNVLFFTRRRSLRPAPLGRTRPSPTSTQSPTRSAGKKQTWSNHVRRREQSRCRDRNSKPRNIKGSAHVAPPRDKPRLCRLRTTPTSPARADSDRANSPRRSGSLGWVLGREDSRDRSTDCVWERGAVFASTKSRERRQARVQRLEVNTDPCLAVTPNR